MRCRCWTLPSRAVRCPCQSRHRHGEGERANHGSKLLFHRFLFHLSECVNADDVLHHSTWGRGRAPPSGKQWAGAPFCGEPTATYLILITIISSLYNGFNGDCLFLTKFRNGVLCLRTYCLFSTEPRHLCEIGPYSGYDRYTVINLRGRAKATRFRSRFLGADETGI